jgi:hypothetical protein
MESLGRRRLSDYSGGMLRNAWLPLAVALVCAGGVGLALSRVPPVYESRATMAFADGDGPATPHRDNLEQRLDSIRSRVFSADTLQAELSRPATDGQTNSGRPHEDLIRELQASVKLFSSNVQGSQFVIAVRRPDAESAHALAANISRLLTVEAHSNDGGATSDETALSAQALELSKQLRSLEERFPWLIDSGAAGPSVVQSQNSKASTQTSRSEQVNQQLRLESLKDRRFLIQQQINDLDRRIGAQKQIVDQQNKNPQMRDNATYATLVARRTELQGQRDTLINRQELTDKHPRVVAIDDQINAINRQLDELRKQESGAVRQSPEARELSSLESERNRLGLELEVNSREIARVSVGNFAPKAPAPEPEVRAQSRPNPSVINEYLALRRDYSEVSSRLSSTTAEKAKTLSTEECSIVQPATAPVAPLWPRKWLMLSISAGAGLLIGAVFSLFLELRKSGLVLGIEDAEFYSKSHILGVVPHAASNRERKRGRWITAARICGVTLAGSLITIGIAALVLETRLIERLGNW